MTREDSIAELNGLIKTCKDGELGYRTAATDVRNTELETVFTEYAKQRDQFARNLQAEVERLGGDPKNSGSITGTLLRSWMDLKSALSSGNGAAIIATCVTGEEARARLLRLKAEEATGATFQKNEGRVLWRRQPALLNAEFADACKFRTWRPVANAALNDTCAIDLKRRRGTVCQ